MRLTWASTFFVAADMVGVDEEDSFGMASEMSMCEVTVESSILVVMSMSPRGSAPRCGVASTYETWLVGSEELESLQEKQQVYFAQAWCV